MGFILERIQGKLDLLKKTKEEQISTALRRELWVTLSGLMDSYVGLGTVHSPSTAWRFVQGLGLTHLKSSH